MHRAFLAAVALTIAGPAAADDITLSSTRTATATRWAWRGPPPASGLFHVDIARGDVRIERSTSGLIEVEAFADTPADGSPITLRIESGGRGLRILDRYPAASAWRGECLPPDGEHGDFWSYGDRLRLVIRVPATVRIDGRVMAGEMHVVARARR